MQIWAVVMVVLVATSIAVMVLYTVPELRVLPDETRMNSSHVTRFNSTHELLMNSWPADSLVMLDFILLSIFALVFTLRLITCPDRVAFAKDPLNMLEFLGVFPLWVGDIVYACVTSKAWAATYIVTVLSYVLTIVRLVYVVRLLRRYPKFYVIKLALRASYQELLLLFAFMIMGSVLFGVTLYLAEIRTNNIEHIPEGIWWAVVTMTTLGYGDTVPTTLQGYAVGGLCALLGILFIAMPIPLIVNNFNKYYQTLETYRLFRKQQR